jgi:hypothetical protein
MGYIGNQPFLGTATGESIADGSIGTVDLSDGAVTAAKLATTAILDKLGYTPVSTSGTGATGTWGVSISGNAATATTAVTATNVSGGTASVTTLAASGNLTFSSTGQRITGDMTNATVANRLAFQNSVTNGSTQVTLFPNGTSQTSLVRVFNNSDPTNASTGLLYIDSVRVGLDSGITGTGTYLPTTFQTGGSERVRIDTSGNVGIGTTPNVELALYKATTPRFHIQNSTSGTQVNDGFQLALSGSDAYIWNFENGASIFGTNNTERMRIDSSGNVGIGGTADATDKVCIKGTLPTSGTYSIAYINRATVPSGSTGGAFGYSSLLYTQAAAFTMGFHRHFNAEQGSIGASSAVTNQFGYYADSSLTGATNNYGFYSNIASGSNRWNFYAAGTAQNYFAGTTTVGNNDISPASSNVAGVAIGSSGYISVSRDSNAVAGFNRKTNDGDIVIFHQDGTTEGSISVSGNTISYNAFAGSHWSQLQDGSKPDILRGTVMESINELCVWPGEQNERLPKSKISDTAGSKKVYGVFMAWDNDWTATNDMLITSVGAFICRVNSSVTVQEGDLLESNGDGTARVQADDIIRSSTIGKVTSTVKTHQYADGSYCVPTVLYCG